MTKNVYIDFEYNGTKEMYLNLVACCLKSDSHPDMQSFWLDDNPPATSTLKHLLLSMRDSGYTFVAYNVVAEASSFISLGIDPTRCKWVDLALEWKMLINHNHKWQYGRQLIDGKKRNTKPPKPKYEQTEEDKQNADNSKPGKSLASACYKMLNHHIDTEHKDEMRDLIISAPSEWTEEQRSAVLDYCAQDVEVLPALHKAINAAFKDTLAYKRRDIRRSDQLLRGDTAARTAMMQCLGYPVNKLRVEKFAAATPNIMKDLQEDINSQFDTPIFRRNKASATGYSLFQKPLKAWIDASEYKDNWLKTDKNQHSLSLDAWGKHFTYSHDYPRGVLPAQILRFLKTRQSLNGFLPAPEKSTGKRKVFFDSFGRDARARAWLNPYGSQSARFQPAATGFIPLKAAWMRSLIEPKKGFSIVCIDYASEEFLLAALLSKDKVMYEGYASGDPYLAFIKRAGVVPGDATKESHPFERNRAKSTILGISYLMGPKGLAKKLTADTGVKHTEPEALDLIQLYWSTYRGYNAWVDKTVDDYNRNGYLRLLDGWVMFGDNDNHRSVANCPVQGAGSCVLRKAIALAQAAGLRVIIPLHDALYIEYPTCQPEKIDKLAEVMREGFSYYFRKDPVVHEWSRAIRLDFDAWGPDMKGGEMVTPGGNKVKTQTVYVDPRAEKEYERFRRYFI